MVQKEKVEAAAQEKEEDICVDTTEEEDVNINTKKQSFRGFINGWFDLYLSKPKSKAPFA